MRLRLSLFGGNLLDLELNFGGEQEPAPSPFGFTGGTRCEAVEITADRNPLAERD